VVGAVLLAAGVLGAGLIVWVVRGVLRRHRLVVVASQAAKYKRVPENTGNRHGEMSEEWSDSEEEFLIVNEKTELMEI
jgi:hypothetical protein